MTYQPIQPTLNHLMQVSIIVAPPRDVGDVVTGKRRFVPIMGGKFVGEKLKGRVLPSGGDWLLQRADGSSQMDARYTLETDAGELIYVQDRGFRHGPQHTMLRLGRGEAVNPKDYYFRTCAQIETGAEKLSWLNRTLVIGSGMRQAGEVTIDFYCVA